MKKPLAFAAALMLFAAGNAPAFAQQHYDPHGGPPHHEEHDNWHKGYRMHDEDWRRGQPVDWRHERLRPPPRGYEWRVVDGRYVLAAIATGIIADIILMSR